MSPPHLLNPATNDLLKPIQHPQDRLPRFLSHVDPVLFTKRAVPTLGLLIDVDVDLLGLGWTSELGNFISHTP